MTATQSEITQAEDTLRKMLESRRKQLASCERMIELLTPEWEKFEARAGHDVYVARDYANHFSAARTHRKEIAALEAAIDRTTSAAPLVEALEAFLAATDDYRNDLGEDSEVELDLARLAGAAERKLRTALAQFRGE